MFHLTRKELESNLSLDFEEVDWLIRMEQDKNWDDLDKILNVYLNLILVHSCPN
jgi:hypothetical protein